MAVNTRAEDVHPHTALVLIAAIAVGVSVAASAYVTEGVTGSSSPAVSAVSYTRSQRPAAGHRYRPTATYGDSFIPSLEGTCNQTLLLDLCLRFPAVASLAGT